MPQIYEPKNDTLFAIQLAQTNLGNNLARRQQLKDRQATLTNKLKNQFNAFPEKFSGAEVDVDKYGNFEYNDKAKQAMKLQKADKSQTGYAKQEVSVLPMPDNMLDKLTDATNRANYDPYQLQMLNAAMGKFDNSGAMDWVKEMENKKKGVLTEPESPELDYNTPIPLPGAKSLFDTGDIGKGDFMGNPFESEINMDASNKLLPGGEYLQEVINKAKQQPDYINQVLETPVTLEEAQLKKQAIQELLTQRPDLVGSPELSGDDTTGGTNFKRETSAGGSVNVSAKQGVPNFTMEQGLLTTTKQKENIIDEVPYRLDDLLTASAFEDMANIPSGATQNRFADMAGVREKFLTANAANVDMEKETQTGTPWKVETRVTPAYVNANLSDRAKVTGNGGNGSGGSATQKYDVVGFYGWDGSPVAVNVTEGTMIASQDTGDIAIDLELEKEDIQAGGTQLVNATISAIRGAIDRSEGAGEGNKAKIVHTQKGQYSVNYQDNKFLVNANDPSDYSKKHTVKMKKGGRVDKLQNIYQQGAQRAKTFYDQMKSEQIKESKKP